jgi:phosphoglycolate phosphatase
MLKALKRRGMRLAVVSSNAEANVRRILGPDTSTLVDDYECGAALFGKARKLRRVAARAGVAPCEAIVIGDEIRDIEAAREAGMASAAVGWGYATPEALAAFGPTLAFATVDALVARLAA